MHFPPLLIEILYLGEFLLIKILGVNVFVIEIPRLKSLLSKFNVNAAKLFNGMVCVLYELKWEEIDLLYVGKYQLCRQDNSC